MEKFIFTFSGSKIETIYSMTGGDNNLKYFNLKASVVLGGVIDDEMEINNQSIPEDEKMEKLIFFVSSVIEKAKLIQSGADVIQISQHMGDCEMRYVVDFFGKLV